MRTFAELAERLNERRLGSLISADELSLKYCAVLAQLTEITERRTQQKLPWGFWARVVLIPQHAVTAIAAILSHLYDPLGVLFCFLLMAIGIFAALHFRLSLAFSGDSIIPALGPFLFLAIAHELGHASACYFFGERPSSIGFAFYLIYPAFYSDVSAAWGLSRRQRVIVDLGGCYFQGIVTALFVVVFCWTHWAPLRVIVVFSLYAALTSLNPVFKFDGYWMLSDLLGVSNLANQRKRIATHLLERICRRDAKKLPWRASITRILLIYSAAAQLVWVWFVLRIGPLCAGQLKAGGRALAVFGAPIVAGNLPTWSQTSLALQSIFSCLILLVMFWNIALMIVMPVWRMIVSRLEAGRTRPLRQAPKSMAL